MEIRVKYLVRKRVKGRDIFYWQPKKHYLLNGKVVKCPIKAKRIAKETNDETDAAKEAGKLNKQLQKWRKGYETIVSEEGTVGWLITEYRKDQRFKQLRASTIALYNHLLPQINKVMGDLPYSKITRKAARAFCVSFADNPRKPSMLAAMGRVLFNFAKDIDDNFKHNPFDELRISKPKPRKLIWSPEVLTLAQEEAFRQGTPSIAIALQLGLDTLQRPADLRSIGWINYNGSHIILSQEKTDTPVEIKLTKKSKIMLDEAKATSTDLTILIDETTRKKYTRDRLCHRIREVCNAAGIDPKLQFRDLRRTGMVRMAERGCTAVEISAVSGHSIDETAKILETYIPRNKVMADNAIDKVEKLEVKQSSKKKSRK